MEISVNIVLESLVKNSKELFWNDFYHKIVPNNENTYTCLTMKSVNTAIGCPV